MNLKNKLKNIIFIGKKNTIDYTNTAVLLSNKFDSLSFLARGNNIKRAIDVSLITLRDYLKGWKMINVELGTDKMDYDNGSAFVSTIKIHISK